MPKKLHKRENSANCFLTRFNANYFRDVPSCKTMMRLTPVN